MIKQHNASTIIGTIANFLPGTVTVGWMVGTAIDLVTEQEPVIMGFSIPAFAVGAVLGAGISFGARYCDLIVYKNHQQPIATPPSDDDLEELPVETQPLLGPPSPPLPKWALHTLLACDWIDEAAALAGPILAVLYAPGTIGTSFSRVVKILMFIPISGAGFIIGYADKRTSENNLCQKENKTNAEEKPDFWTVSSSFMGISGLFGVFSVGKSFVEAIGNLAPQTLAGNLGLNIPTGVAALVIATGSSYTLYKMNFNHQSQSFAINEVGRPRAQNSRAVSLFFKRTAQACYLTDISLSKASMMNTAAAALGSNKAPYPVSAVVQLANAGIGYYCSKAENDVARENLKLKPACQPCQQTRIRR